MVRARPDRFIDELEAERTALCGPGTKLLYFYAVLAQNGPTSCGRATTAAFERDTVQVPVQASRRTFVLKE
jgi:hypothetical protein